MSAAIKKASQIVGDMPTYLSFGIDSVDQDLRLEPLKLAGLHRSMFCDCCES